MFGIPTSVTQECLECTGIFSLHGKMQSPPLTSSPHHCSVSHSFSPSRPIFLSFVFSLLPPSYCHQYVSICLIARRVVDDQVVAASGADRAAAAAASVPNRARLPTLFEGSAPFSAEDSLSLSLSPAGPVRS